MADAPKSVILLFVVPINQDENRYRISICYSTDQCSNGRSNLT